jgi:ketosteroid isomerase-like protein
VNAEPPAQKDRRVTHGKKAIRELTPSDDGAAPGAAVPPGTGIPARRSLREVDRWYREQHPEGRERVADTGRAMSRENVELVRRVCEANDRGDLTAVFAAYDPEIEWHVLGLASAELGFDPVYVGHDGVRTFWRLWLSAWETTSFEYDEFIDAGEHVVVVQTQRNRGRTSGIELEWNSYAQVWTMQDAKVVRVEFFPTRGEALEAVRLRD